MIFQFAEVTAFAFSAEDQQLLLFPWVGLAQWGSRLHCEERLEVKANQALCPTKLSMDSEAGETEIRVQCLCLTLV